MKKISLCILIVISFSLFSQKSDYVQNCIDNIHLSIEAYNNQDYKKLKKPWFPLGKILVSKKKLKKEFSPYYKRFGKLNLLDINQDNKYTFTAKLVAEKDSLEFAYLKYIFNDNSKFQGFGFSTPNFIYDKSKTNRTPFPSTESIDSLIVNDHIKNLYEGFNGCVAVTNNDEVLFKKCYGQRNFDMELTNNDSTLFDLASCSKQFTAFAILLLKQRGLLSLDDPVNKYLSNFPYPNVKIIHLLTHTSGLPDYEQVFLKHWDKNNLASNEDIIPLFTNQQLKLNFDPNTYFEYSNTGYVMLALIIENLSGMTYADFLKENIFNPLEMKDSRVINDRKSKFGSNKNIAIGYLTADDLRNKDELGSKKYLLPDSSKQYNYVIFMDKITGDGTVNSTINNLIVWNRALYGNDLLSDENLEKMFSKHMLNDGTSINYGLGTFIKSKDKKHDVLYHTGGWPGYYSGIFRYPQSKSSVIILTNNSYDPFLKLVDQLSFLILKKL